MSSATSIDSRRPRGSKAAVAHAAAKDPGLHRATHTTHGGDPGLHPATHTTHGGDPGLRPWQFFLLAGMLAATAGVIVATGQSAASIIILSLTVVSTSLVALGVYRSLSPLVLPDTVQAPAMIGGFTRAALEREKTLVLRSIKELEFDFAMGKIAQSDFDEMGGRLRARAIGLMRQLDAGGYASAIEQELSRRLGPKTRAAAARDSAAIVQETPAGAAEQAAPIRDEHESDLDSPAGSVVCTCGTQNDADARFCKACGTKLVG